MAAMGKLVIGVRVSTICYVDTMLLDLGYRCQMGWPDAYLSGAKLGGWRWPGVAGLGGAAAGRNFSNGSADLTSTRLTNSYDAMNTSLCRNLRLPAMHSFLPSAICATATSAA